MASGSPTTTTASGSGSAAHLEEKFIVKEPIQKKKIVFEQTYGNVTLKEFEGASAVEGAILIEGMPSVSLTSMIAANYLVDLYELPIIAFLTSPEFPPRAIVYRGQPSHAVRLLGNSKLVVLLCEFKLSPEATTAVINAVLDFASRHKIRLIFAVEGLPEESDRTAPAGGAAAAMAAEKKDDAEKVHFLTSNREIFDKLKGWGNEPVDVGVIDGVMGGLLSRSVYTDIDLVCLLALLRRPDPGTRSAVTVLTTMAKLLPDLTIDTAPLEKKAASLEQQVRNVLKSSQEKPHPSQLAMYS